MAKQTTTLVSGASSGIGLAISQLLLKQGHRVLGISRGRRASSIDDESFIPVTLDLANISEIETTIATLKSEHKFDHFIHAAGQGHFGSIEQFSTAQIEQSLRVNLISAMIICRSLVPDFRQRGQGQMIFIGSESGLNGGKKGALYSAAKFGLRGFCQSLCADCASDGIRVSLINPGMVRSPFFDQQSFRPGDKPENAIEVEDVAELVLQILNASENIVIDEINLSPRVKSINFGSK